MVGVLTNLVPRLSFEPFEQLINRNSWRSGVVRFVWLLADINLSNHESCNYIKVLNLATG